MEPAAKPGAHAAWHERHSRVRGELDDLAHLFGCPRQDDDVRTAFGESAIVAVDGQVFRRLQHAVFAELLDQASDQIHQPLESLVGFVQEA